MKGTAMKSLLQGEGHYDQSSICTHIYSNKVLIDCKENERNAFNYYLIRTDRASPPAHYFHHPVQSPRKTLEIVNHPLPRKTLTVSPGDPIAGVQLRSQVLRKKEPKPSLAPPYHTCKYAQA